MKKTRVLYIEDSYYDFELFQHATHRLNYDIKVDHAVDSESGLEALYPKGKTEPTFYDLVFLDMNLTGSSGLECLKRIRQKKTDKFIPILVFTSSLNPQHLNQCYAAGANAYLIKPLDYKAFTKSLNTIFAYWLDLVVIPSTLKMQLQAH